jgi:hypothetical protein
MSKSPSQCDGKPIGTPMDAKSPFHAGVTMGPDQIERMEQLRKLRNRALKAERKAAQHAAIMAIPEAEREQAWVVHKARRNRADNMTRALRKGTKVPAVAGYWSARERRNVTTDEVLAEVKWLADYRNRHKARHRGHAKPPARGLPHRDIRHDDAAPTGAGSSE